MINHITLANLPLVPTGSGSKGLSESLSFWMLSRIYIRNLTTLDKSGIFISHRMQKMWVPDECGAEKLRLDTEHLMTVIPPRTCLLSEITGSDSLASVLLLARDYVPFPKNFMFSLSNFCHLARSVAIAHTHKRAVRDFYAQMCTNITCTQ